jgi:hypothetical protein
VQDATGRKYLQITYFIKDIREIQDGNGDRAAYLSSNLAEKLETHLPEVKHQEEPKTQHSKHLDHGRLLHAMI